MELKLQDYVITIKDFCSRKLKKEINKVLFKNIKMKGTADGQQIEGISPEALDEANDVALVGMVEKIERNGDILSVEIKTFDEMNSVVVDKLIEEINKITNKQIPNA
jgi:hypothetical protein